MLARKLRVVLGQGCTSYIKPRFRDVSKALYCATTTWRETWEVEDEADWHYAGEWWGSDDSTFLPKNGRDHLLTHSSKGNGVLTVTSHPSLYPTKDAWPSIERQLQEKYEKLHGLGSLGGHVKIKDFEWRVLRFNYKTRQSVAKVMSVFIDSYPRQVFVKQLHHCLAFPYVKSMLTSGLTALASTNFDLEGAISGAQRMRILCIGNGGGTVPLYLASTIKGAVVDVAEIDEAVIHAAQEKMGFPNFRTSLPKSNELRQIMQRLFWEDIQDRLFLYQADGESFISDSLINDESEKTSPYYDMVFIDAYNGEDIFPFKFRDRDGKFLNALNSKLHPTHGTVVVNLHQDSMYSSAFHISGKNLPLGRKNMKVSEIYRDALCNPPSQETIKHNSDTIAFTTCVPILANVTLVVARGFDIEDGKSSMAGTNISMSYDNTSGKPVLQRLMSKSDQVQKLFKFPFDCSEYVTHKLRVVNC